jgi:magnesium-transporting ATPase (P-type)
LLQYGPNLFRDQPQRSLIVQFLRRFANPLVIILLVASVVSALAGELTSFYIIVLLVLLSVVLDFVQEHRADRVAEQLRATVLFASMCSTMAHKENCPFAKWSRRCRHSWRRRSRAADALARGKRSLC